ncbi:MAG: aminomethyltransferase family protein [Euryarchaeota archaeon]|nr:aminomethyltransferase family protein [Euryarchaeota archaeon]
MTLVGDSHTELGATFVSRSGREVVDHYGRPAVAHRAVRNGVGVIEMAYGIVAIEGDDRVEYVDNIVSNRVPEENGEGCYALLLNPQGRIQSDLYIYNAGERLLLFTPPAEAAPLVEAWREKVFIQDVEITDESDSFGVFGVHGPMSTEKIASVLNHAGAPEPELTFERGSMGDAGVTVVASDNPTGEEGYEVICGADDAESVLDTLINHGLNAAPFGYRTFDSLSLEAGTPLFETELHGRVPNTAGLRHGLDFEKGCYVGQELVSKVSNRGQPSSRLVGLRTDSLVEAGATVTDAGEEVGEVTRAVESPSLDEPIALAFVSFDAQLDSAAVETAEAAADAEAVDLPFVTGSRDSLRLPSYPDPKTTDQG